MLPQFLRHKSLKSTPLELMPEVHNYGHVAVSGLCQARGSHWNKAERGSLFITLFNTNRIVRAKLKNQGSTHVVDSQEDFAVSSSRDFHPTDALEDADGSLLVIDTGGWFHIGCPQSQSAKAHIRGAIYRIRRKSAPTVSDARGQQLEWTKASALDLLNRLADDRPAVRDRAVTALASLLRQETQSEHWQELSTAAAKLPPPARLPWVEALAWINTKQSLAALANLVGDHDAAVRQAAARALLYANVEDLPHGDELFAQLVKEVQHGSPAACRTALATLGRLYAKRADVAETLLVSGAALENDRLRRHAYTFALLESGDREALVNALAHADPAVQTAAAVALEVLRRPQPDSHDHEWLEIPAPFLGQPLTEDERKRVLETEDNLPPGDIQRGQRVFASDAAACAKCHRAGNTGGKVGPDLTHISRVRTPRDLLEAVLFPSASFSRGFAPYTVADQNGRVQTGIILGESPTQLRVGLDAANAVDIPNAHIESIRAAELSIMPANLAQQISPQDLADLWAYLQSLR